MLNSKNQDEQSKKPRHPITNEELLKKFTNQFELVNYAIRLTESMMRSGRDPHVETDLQNRAFQVLEEIASGADRVEDLEMENTQRAYEFGRNPGKVVQEVILEEAIILEPTPRRSRKAEVESDEDF